MGQSISHTLISFAYIFLYIACGVVIVRRFRGSVGAALGGIAFGVWAAAVFSRFILHTLHVGWGLYWLAIYLPDTAATGCLLAALITGRVYSEAPGAGGTRGATNTGR
jgi:hypothetical protein